MRWNDYKFSLNPNGVWSDDFFPLSAEVSFRCSRDGENNGSKTLQMLGDGLSRGYGLRRVAEKDRCGCRSQWDFRGRSFGSSGADSGQVGHEVGRLAK